VEQTYKNRAVAASCDRTFQLALAEYNTADHRYETSPTAVQTPPAVALVILIFFTHAQTISILMLKLLGLLFGMLSEHKN
jgi:hypothetical protein